MRRLASAATWEPSQPLSKPNSTNARCSTSRSTEERANGRAAGVLAACGASPSSENKSMPRTTKKWSRKVSTDSTHPPEGLFTKDPETIARSLASKKVSPKGPGSGMRMLTFFINRAGKNLSATEKAKLKKAKELLSERVKAARQKKAA